MRGILGACAILAALAWVFPAQAACHLPVKDGPVVSIGGDVTEIVYALGAGDRVIAVDITSREPKVARDLPQVGYMRQLSAEPILSLSPKLANSTPTEREGGRFASAHEAGRLNFEAMQQLLEAAPDRQIKFVVTSESDVAEIEQVLSGLRGWRREDVMLMPEGTDAATLDDRANWLVDVCKRSGYRFCPRLQIHLFGNRRAT